MNPQLQQEASQATPPTVERGQDLLREILARPEYAPPPRTWIDELRERLAEWRDELLRSILDAIGLPDGLGESARDVLMVAALAALVAATIWVVARAARSETEPEALDELVGADDPLDPIGLGARRLIQSAEAHAARGEWVRALELLYSGCLGSLDARGRVRFEARKTAREYARELRDAERDDWRRLVGACEPVVYGEHAEARAAWLEARAAAEALGALR